MTVVLRLFAGMRERAGRDRIELELPEGSSVGGLRGALGDALPQLAAALASCRFAIADEFVDDGTPVPPTSIVDCIPPVSGG